MKTYLAAFAAIAAVASAVPASAETQPSERVYFADLNLDTAQGQSELRQRLDRAAYKVCRFDADGQLRSTNAEQQCVRQARTAAKIRIAQIMKEERLGG